MFPDGVQYRKDVANAIAMYYIPCNIFSYIYFRSESLYFKKVKKFSVNCEDNGSVAMPGLKAQYRVTRELCNAQMKLVP